MRYLMGTELLIAGLVLAGCAAEPLDDLDADEATGSVVADVSEGTPQACAVLKIANTADKYTLDYVIKLDHRAAENIAAFRAAKDGVEGTEDDRWFTTLKELDKVKQVGKSAFKKLEQYASASGVACGAVPVQILAFNDYHGALEVPTGSGGKIVVSKDAAVAPVDAGGAEYLATHIKALRALEPNTLVVAAGDIIGATPLLSSAFHDEPTIESVNAFGLDIASVGNHEFDEGLAELYRMQHGGCHPVDGCQDGDGFEGARFPYLAANVVTKKTGKTVFPPYAVRHFGNARVAFIGMTLEGTPEVVTEAGTKGLKFLDEAATVNALVPKLRAKGIEAIVVLLHEGGAATGLYNGCEGISGPIFDIVANLDPAVDVVVSGHTNAAHVCDINGRLVTSAAHNGRLVTDIHLEVDELSGDVATMKADNVIVTRTVEKDAAQSAIIQKYKTLVAPFANRVVGSLAGDLLRAPTPAGDSPLGDVIADAQLAGTQGAGAVIAFMNPGGVRADLIAGAVAGGEQPGELTYGEIFAVQPFANNIVTVTITGAQLETLLEQQWFTGGVDRSLKPMILLPSAGFSYSWDSTRPAGDRVDPATMHLNGVVIDPAGSYRVTINSFLAGGGDGFPVLRDGTNRVSGAIDLDVFEQYFKSHSPLSVPAVNRITKVQ